MGKLVRFLKGFEKELILGPLFKLTEAVFELFVPLVVAKIIDVGVKEQNQPYILKMGGLLLLLGVLGLVFALTAQYFAAVAQQGVGTAMRNALFAKINSFSHGELDRFGTHSLVTRMTNDVNQLQFAVAMFIRLVVRAPFLVVGAMVMAISIDWKLSLIFFVTAPLLALIIYGIMKKTVPFFRVMQKKLDKISMITRENLSGARVIRAFAKEEQELERFTKASAELADTSVGAAKWSALMNPLNYVVMNLGMIAILWFGGFQINIGALTQGQVVALVNYMSQILLALVVVANLVVTFTKAFASAGRVNEVFDTCSSVVSKTKTAVSERAGETAAVTFRDVSFSYGGAGEQVLSHISFQANKGETIGIIGGTGSGKSTLIHLIPRFYDASAGEVLVDGVNAADYPLEQLRRKIGLVPQRAVLISGTILENIRWGREKATEEEVCHALETAQALSFVQALPKGLNARVEQGGSNLSGGQRQRLTIARALVGRPDILILDDSTSALDAATDAALREALRLEKSNRTVLMVSQRAASIKSADRILVLDEGESVGFGTHRELLQNCPVYREICISQNMEDCGGEQEATVHA